jgi:aspartate aminotransferase
MNFLAKRVSNIKPSPTIAATAKAAELKSNGKDVIGLGAGEPDFDTPIHIKNAAIKAINSGKTKYTAVDGIKELKQQIVKKFKDDNEINYSLNEITVGTGGKQVLYNALMATVNEGDEVIIPAPFWVSYPDMVILADGVPVITKCEEKDNFKITPEILEKNITDKTKWLILNSPSNPTGIGYEKSELIALSKILEKYPQVLIMVDDMYEYLTYDNFEFTTLVQVNNKLKDRVLTCNGVSKSFCMTGWRIGYAGGPEWMIKAISKIQSQSTSNPNSIAQWASKAALEGDMAFLTNNLSSFDRRRKFVVDGLNKINGLSCKNPNGAFYVFPNCEGVIGKTTPKGKTLNTDQDYCDYLLEDGLVAVVPGSAFGLSPYFRISYATSDENLNKAIDRIENVTNKLS